MVLTLCMLIFSGDLVFGNVERISCGPEPSFSGWRGRTLHSIDHPSRRETSMFPDYSDSITEVNRSRTVVLCRAKLFICRGYNFLILNVIDSQLNDTSLLKICFSSSFFSIICFMHVGIMIQIDVRPQTGS